MRLGAIQSNYLPWRGYFDFIASCDVFVIHDCVQYTKGDWRNRNLVKLPDRKTHWITVPVSKCAVETKINEVEIAGEWRGKHRGMLESSFCKSPYKQQAMDLWECGDFSNLSDLNVALIKRICAYLGIATPLIDSRDLNLKGAKTDRILDMCEKVGANIYLSGPAAKDYLEVELMADNGVAVEWKEYDYPDYPQGWGEFNGRVTVLDLIANTGDKARDYLRPVCG